MTYGARWLGRGLFIQSDTGGVAADLGLCQGVENADANDRT